MSTTYAEGAVRLTRLVDTLITTQIDAELAATEAALDLPALARPAQIRRSYWQVTQDLLPGIGIHLMDDSAEREDSLGDDTITTRLRVYVVVGQSQLGARDETTYSDGILAYIGAIRGLLVRELPRCDGANAAGVIDVQYRRASWEPAVSETTSTWIQAAFVDFDVRQEMRANRPEED